MADSERLIQQYHNPAEGTMTQIALAPCSPFLVSEEVMLKSAGLAEKHNVQLHTHLAETEDENSFCLEKFGCRPLNYLEKVGWLNKRTWLAHGIHFASEEIQKLSVTKIGISHCPSSNMLLASGFCHVPELEKAGGAVGLGVEGSVSNDCSNLMQEVRQAFYDAKAVLRFTNHSSGRLALSNFRRSKCFKTSGIGDYCPGKTG